MKKPKKPKRWEVMRAVESWLVGHTTEAMDTAMKRANLAEGEQREVAWRVVERLLANLSIADAMSDLDWRARLAEVSERNEELLRKVESGEIQGRQ